MTVVAALGDSITAGTPLWAPNPRVRAEIGDALNEESSWPYWAARANPTLELRNHGINLETTAQIAARLGDAAAGADVLVIQGGINDIVQGQPPETAVANFRSMISRGQELGLRVLVTELIPCNGFPATAPAILDLNERIGRLATELSVSVLPFYTTLEDPDVPERIAATWTDDGNHPSIAGHRQLGELAFTL